MFGQPRTEGGLHRLGPVLAREVAQQVPRPASARSVAQLGSARSARSVAPQGSPRSARAVAPQGSPRSARERRRRSRRTKPASSPAGGCAKAGGCDRARMWVPWHPAVAMHPPAALGRGHLPPPAPMKRRTRRSRSVRPHAKPTSELPLAKGVLDRPVFHVERGREVAACDPGAERDLVLATADTRQAVSRRTGTTGWPRFLTAAPCTADPNCGPSRHGPMNAFHIRKFSFDM
jgi:hypothetical protein